MADDEKPTTPKKRAPHKTPTAAPDGDQATDTNPQVESTETAGVGREVTTATSRDLDTPSSDPAFEKSAATERVLNQRALNRNEFGHLYLHTRTRDIAVVLDGESASRVMSVFAATSTRFALQDQMHPELANMRNLWVSIDLNEVVALSWIPGLPSGTEQVMTVDPPAPKAMTL